MLVRLGHPLFHSMFQLMIFAALLESGTGSVHAINERIAGMARRTAPLASWQRGGLALLLMAPCMLIAERIGLIALIASGYRALAAAMIAIYVLPLLLAAIVHRARRGSSATAFAPEMP